MAVSDPIADFITVLRNASSARKDKFSFVASKMLESICSILKSENYIQDFRVIEDGKKKVLRVHLKPGGKAAPFSFLGRISRPGLRRYVSSKKVPKILNGLGVAILSTPKGLMSDKRARQENVGGELLLKIY